ncbi:MAG TPA: 50S ribosomal protein L10 [Archaeoglobaceae archaeon]|nr:50S ribosomal protein L10 [Archaeoglobaceae archaeon]
MAAVKGKVPEWKTKTVEELRDIFNTYPVVGFVSFRDVTAGQMQEIRRKFRDIGIIKVTKNSIIEKALNSLDNEFSKLKDYLGDQIAIVGSELNPFKLYKRLEETKVPTPLKPGQISPIDVVIEKGPTSFPPGPIIGDLQAAGLPAAIERGKVVIKNTVTLIKAGEKVTPEVARGLELLDIKPSKVGLDVRVLYDRGVILTPEVLSIDAPKVFDDFVEAYSKAFNLAVNSAYVVPETAEILLIKAHNDARNLAINAGIFEKDVVEDIIVKSYNEMLALASHLPTEAIDGELEEKIRGIAQISVAERAEEKKEEEEKEEEEEEKEEEAIEGLGALFG